jgi:histone H3/H4
MIKLKEIKVIAAKEHKKISKDALITLGQLTNDYILNLIKIASRNANIFGRVVIKSEDIKTDLA